MARLRLEGLMLAMCVGALVGCPAEPPGTTTGETGDSGDGDGDMTGDGDGDSGDGDMTGDGDGDMTGDGDGDMTGDEDPLWFAFQRTLLADESIEYATIDIHDPDLVGETIVHLSGPLGSGVGWIGGTPFGSLLLRDTPPELPVVKLLNVDEAGTFELVRLVPDELPGYAPQPSWTADASAALVRAYMDPGDTSVPLHWVTYADKQPIDATLVSGDHGPSPHFAGVSLAKDDSGLVYVVDEDDDDTYELYYAAIDTAPGAPTQIGQLDQPSQLGLGLDADKLIYRHDHDLDEFRDLWVRGLEADAQPVLVNTIVSGGNLRTQWSEDGQTLLYWTGDTQWGELYAVGFDGATPTAPVRVDSPEYPAWTKDFQFDSSGRILYRFGDADAHIQGLARLEFVGGQPGPVEIVTEALPADSEIENSIYSDGQLIYQIGDNMSQMRSLNYVDLSGPVASEPLRFVEGIPDFLIAFSMPHGDSQRVIFVADLDDQERHIMTVELSDPELTLVDLATELPEGWSVPISARMTPDGQQVVFVARSDSGDDEVPYRTRADGSGPLEALMDAGYEIGITTFMQP